MPKSHKIIIMVIALTALTIIFLNERNIRPKINLVKDAEKIKKQIETLKLPKITKQILIDNSYMINNIKHKINGYGVIFLEEDYSFFLQRDNMCVMKLPYSDDIMFQDVPCPEYRLFNNVKIPLKEEGDGLYKENNEYIFKGSNSINYINYNDKLYRIVKFTDNGFVISGKYKGKEKLSKKLYEKTILKDSYIDNYKDYIILNFNKNILLEGSGRKEDPYYIKDDLNEKRN